MTEQILKEQKSKILYVFLGHVLVLFSLCLVAGLFGWSIAKDHPASAWSEVRLSTINTWFTNFYIPHPSYAAKYLEQIIDMLVIFSGYLYLIQGHGIVYKRFIPLLTKRQLIRQKVYRLVAVLFLSISYLITFLVIDGKTVHEFSAALGAELLNLVILGGLLRFLFLSNPRKKWHFTGVFILIVIFYCYILCSFFL